MSWTPGPIEAILRVNTPWSELTLEERYAIHVERISHLFMGNARKDTIGGGSTTVEAAGRRLGLLHEVSEDHPETVYKQLAEAIADSMTADDLYGLNKGFPNRSPILCDPDGPEFTGYSSYVIKRARYYVLPKMLDNHEEESRDTTPGEIDAWLDGTNSPVSKRTRKTLPLPTLVNDNGDFEEVPYAQRRVAGILAFNAGLREAGAFESSAERFDRIMGYDHGNLTQKELADRLHRESVLRREAEVTLLKPLAINAGVLDIWEIGRTVICARATDGPRAHEVFIDEMLARYDCGEFQGGGFSPTTPGGNSSFFVRPSSATAVRVTPSDSPLPSAPFAASGLRGLTETSRSAPLIAELTARDV